MNEMKTLNVHELEVKYPEAAKAWLKEARRRLDGQADEEEIDEMIENSYFIIDSDDAIVGEGLEAYTKFIWYPGISSDWCEFEDDEDIDEPG